MWAIMLSFRVNLFGHFKHLILGRWHCCMCLFNSDGIFQIRFLHSFSKQHSSDTLSQSHTWLEKSSIISEHQLHSSTRKELFFDFLFRVLVCRAAILSCDCKTLEALEIYSTTSASWWLDNNGAYNYLPPTVLLSPHTHTHTYIHTHTQIHSTQPYIHSTQKWIHSTHKHRYTAHRDQHTRTDRDIYRETTTHIHRKLQTQTNTDTHTSTAAQSQTQSPVHENYPMCMSLKWKSPFFASYKEKKIIRKI